MDIQIIIVLVLVLLLLWYTLNRAEHLVNANADICDTVFGPSELFRVSKQGKGVQESVYVSTDGIISVIQGSTAKPVMYQYSYNASASDLKTVTDIINSPLYSNVYSGNYYNSSSKNYYAWTTAAAVPTTVDWYWTICTLQPNRCISIDGSGKVPVIDTLRTNLETILGKIPGYLTLDSIAGVTPKVLAERFKQKRKEHMTSSIADSFGYFPDPAYYPTKGVKEPAMEGLYPNPYPQNTWSSMSKASQIRS